MHCVLWIFVIFLLIHRNSFFFFFLSCLPLITCNTVPLNSFEEKVRSRLLIFGLNDETGNGKIHPFLDFSLFPSPINQKMSKSCDLSRTLSSVTKLGNWACLLEGSPSAVVVIISMQCYSCRQRVLTVRLLFLTVRCLVITQVCARSH